MSDELRLPDDLAACEARLAARSPAPTQLDRDQLMYQAGWAACEASLAAMNPPPSKGGARGGSNRGTIAAWSVTSAALAASLAVAVTLRVQNVAPPNATDNPRNLIASESRSTVLQQAKPPASEDAVLAKIAALLTDDDHLAPTRVADHQTTALAANRAFSLIGEATDKAPNGYTPVSTAADDVPPKPAKTASQLLHDYLPKASSSVAEKPRRPFWIWNSTRSGDTI